MMVRIRRLLALLALGLAAGAPARGHAQEPPEPPVEGVHGATSCSVVHGWAFDPADPGRRLLVDVYLDDGKVATVAADDFRPDLLAHGKGDGAYGFTWALPPEVRTTSPRLLELRIAGTDRRLRGTPRPLACGDAAGGEDPPGLPAADGDPGAGGSPDPGAPEAPPKRITPARLPGDGGVRVDGRLDDDVWRQVTFRDDFLQKGSTRGHARAERTEVAFAYDAEALYVAARMEGSGGGDGVWAQAGRRDDPGNQERLLVSLDTRGDRRTAYTFGVTAGGVRIDHVHPQDYEHRVDASFDPVWEARTTVGPTGWTAEMRIPFAQLRFPAGARQSFGLNVRRWDPASQLNVYWVVVPLSGTGWASRFGELGGLEDVSPAYRVEVTPYALGGVTVPTGFEGADEETLTRYGADATVGLGSNLDLDLTVRPDFGQVEADPAEVNLAQFETAFEERRPFFAEEAHLFETEGPRWFYSRRIGSLPNIDPPARLLTRPLSATILGAGKLVGRVAGRTSVAALAAVSEAERAPGVDASGAERSVEIVPRTVTGVGRVRFESAGSGSALGFLATGVHRSFGEPALASSLASQAVSGAVDWRVRMADGRYVLTGWAGASHVRGDSAAILRIQRSGAHLFHRPDATHVEADPGRTDLTGYTAGLRLAKEAGEHWLWEVAGSWESPGFEIRDAGAFPSADDLEGGAALRYRVNGLQGPVRNAQVALFANVGWNNEGIRTFARPGAFASVTWRNLWRVYVDGGVDLPSTSDDLTRGGPLMATPLGWSASAGLSNNFASRAHWTLSGDYYGDEYGGWSWAAYAAVVANVAPWLTLSATPGLSRSDASHQFYGSVPGGPDATYGRRYLFADLERQEVSAQLRVDVSPAPDLTLELYAEPFVSTGRYDRFGELAAAGTDDLRIYGEDGTSITPTEDGSFEVVDGEGSFVIGGADFDVRSFRSNAVLRWEWRAGSTLFLIWQQNRSAYRAVWDEVEPAELLDAVRDPGNHVFTAKLTWWLGLG